MINRTFIDNTVNPQKTHAMHNPITRQLVNGIIISKIFAYIAALGCRRRTVYVDNAIPEPKRAEKMHLTAHMDNTYVHISSMPTTGPGITMPP